MSTHSTGLDDRKFRDLEAGVDHASTAANHPRGGESRLNKVDDTETHEISTGTPAHPETPTRPAAADDCEIKVETPLIHHNPVFAEHGNQVEGTPATHDEDFSKTITEKLASLTRNGDVAALDHREVEDLANSLKTSLDRGIDGAESDLLKRKKLFGSNTYPHRKGRTFLKCVWDAGRTNATLMILMTIAAASLATGIMTKGIGEGWYEACCVITRLISVLAIDSQAAYYRKSGEFQRTHEKMRNMDVEVTRGGTRRPVPICDIVVGDMVHLQSSTQVPADGVLVTSPGDSLGIDKHSVKIFPTRPILRYGSFVAHGSGTMLVLGVGENTEWGSLMGSKDQPKRNPLRARMNRFATLMSVIGLIIAVGVGAVLLYKYVSTNDGKHSINTYLVIAGDVVTMVLITVPVGLSFALTSSLLLAARKLMTHEVRVRTMSACGTAAFTNSLVCDKGPCCQPGAKEAVQQFRNAGIEVRMVTAENLEAAQATALECGIIGNAADDELIIEGKDFSAKSPTERQEIAARIKVMAGCSPKDQLLLVQALKQKGERVAVCGCDAASLREADVGLALGNQATEIAKESSDIIILDDEFTTIARVFRWGRYIDGNFLKFLRRQLCLNVVGFMMNAFTLLHYGHIAVNAVEFMWLNLVIYALGPLSSTMEPLSDESDDLMHRVPMDPRKCIDSIGWRKVLIRVTYQMAALLAVNFQGIIFLKPKHYTRDHTTKVQNTMIFNTFAVCQILIEFEARKKGVLSETRKWLRSNYRFIIVGALVLGFQFIIIEFGGKPFSTVRLNFEQWKFSATFGLIELLFLGILLIKKLAHSNQ